MARKVLEPPVEVKYTQLFINGEFVDAKSGETFPTFDPRTGEIITQVAEASAEDVDRAVEAARNAFDNGPWPRMTGYERGRILFKFADLIENHSKELAALETWDNGKPYSHALFVIDGAIKYLRCHAGWGDKIFGQTMRVDGSYHAYTLCEPIGVVGQITPWNFPLYMFVTKVSAALICGNTVVVKPAEQTPLVPLFCAKLAADAGLPSGVLNVVPGYGPVAGAAIATHMEIDKLAFTGSTEVGRLLMEASARSNLKRVSLELGGKTPLIVFQDANINVAAELANQSVFFNMGQVCVAGTRVFVQETVYEEFLQRVVEVAQKRVVGDPFQEGVDFGPQIDKEQFDKTLQYIQLGKEEGAKLLLGGERFGNTGFYIQPTIFADVQDSMKIAQDEIFGPVMSILKFGTVDEVVRRSNATRYGLAAGIVTKDIETALKCSRALKSGTVWINTVHVIDPVLPFGGYKMSGFGRENGIEGLKEYMQVKSVIVSLPDSPWL